MTPEMIRQLPAGNALVICGGVCRRSSHGCRWSGRTRSTVRPGRARQAIAHLVVQPEDTDWDIPDSVPDDIMDLGPADNAPPPAQAGQRSTVPLG